jgi:hypothetical protein
MSMDDDVFRCRLLPGERVTWSGRPARGVIFTAKNIFLIPFSVIWLGFVAIWIGAAAATHAPWPMLLFGLAFFAIGSTLRIGRLWLDAWLRAGTRYALTDRVLIARPKPFGEFTAVALDRLPDARLSERKNGSGTIRFGQATSIFGAAGFGAWLPSLDSTPQFVAIPEARRVFNLVQGAAIGGR